VLNWKKKFGSDAALMPVEFIADDRNAPPSLQMPSP
jgi:hypothetical protein